MVKETKPLEEIIISLLILEYDLMVMSLESLALGADRYASIFRALASTGKSYLVKWRRSTINPLSITMPRTLFDQGIDQVIPPVKTKSGADWVENQGCCLILYPFIEGLTADEKDLSPIQWISFGRALKAIHQLSLPPSMLKIIPRENYASTWRDSVKIYLEQAEQMQFDDIVSQELFYFLRLNHQMIRKLVQRAETLALVLQSQSNQTVLCHGDIHEANLLVAANGRIFLVDWDDAIFAPKERDLMFIGGGIIGRWNKPEQENWFYQGYGEFEINHIALAYYRCERIITDIAEFCDQILHDENSLEERQTFLNYLKSNFQPGGTLDIALWTFQQIEEK